MFVGSLLLPPLDTQAEIIRLPLLLFVFVCFINFHPNPHYLHKGHEGNMSFSFALREHKLGFFMLIYIRVGTILADIFPPTPNL